MANRGGLAVYVTSHGFGHLNRTVAVLNRLPADLPLVVRCRADLIPHWHERMMRPARFEPHTSDVGALNPPGDSAATDGPGTLALASKVHSEAMGRIESDIATLRDEGTAAVLCDAPAVPLVAAKRAGIPGFLLANFTWADIYAPHARNAGPEAMRFVAELRDAYNHATLTFRTEPALSMRHSAPKLDVGMIVTPGRDRRAELRSSLGLSDGDKLVYFYVGRYGQASLGWERLAAMKGIHFIAFHPASIGPLPNLHVVSPEAWTGADLAASCDVMVTKAGYGTACEAMASGTPMIYPPRVGFAEHRALDRALRAWGGGVPASARAFGELRLGTLLKAAFSLRPGPPPFPSDGAEQVARRLVSACVAR